MSRFNWAPTAYRLLDGVLCIFKPEGVSVPAVIRSIKNNLTGDLNALPCYQHEIALEHTNVTENRNVNAVSLLAEPCSIQDWSEHRLVLGDRYEESDFSINFIDGICTHSSGVLVLGLGPFGRQSTGMIAQSKFLRVYHVKGRFGWATHNFSPKGRILERTSFGHVTRSKLEKLCAAAQSAHTRQMYRLQGVNPDSQEAYEMAATGIIRPAQRKSEPILYGVKCIDFQPPDFTLEIHSINETSRYLQKFIHDLALKLKTTAVCSGVRRLRYGNFDLKRALLRQHWHLDHIVDNIESNMELLMPEKLFVGTEAQKVELLPPRQNAGSLPGQQPLLGLDDQDSHDTPASPENQATNISQNSNVIDDENSDNEADLKSKLNCDNTGVR